MKIVTFAPAILLVLLLAIGSRSASASEPAAANRIDTEQDRILVTLPLAPDRRFRLGVDGRPAYPIPFSVAQRLANADMRNDLQERFSLTLEAEWPMPAIDLYCFVFSVGDPERRAAVMSAIENDPDLKSIIAGVQAMQFFSSSSGDPIPVISSDDDTRLERTHVHARGAHVGISVIDSGVDLQHEDLVGADITAINMVDDDAVPPEAHGTAVVGLIAARTDNGIGIRGIAPDAHIELLRACWETPDSNGRAVCNSFTLAKALLHAIDSTTTIINLSISGPRDPLLELLTAKAAERGKLLVAAGNPDDEFPAAAPGVIPALDVKGQPSVDTLMMTPQPGNRYSLRAGSSLIAARLSGYVAILQEMRPQLDRDGLARVVVEEDPSLQIRSISASLVPGGQ